MNGFANYFKHQKPEARFKNQDTTRKQSYYNNSMWRSLSQNARIAKPLCESCLIEDKISASTQVHHAIPFDDLSTDYLKRRLLLDTNNLVCLCKDCHHSWHKNKERLTDKQIQFFTDKLIEIKKSYEKELIFLKINN